MHSLSILHHSFFLAGNLVTQQSLIKKKKKQRMKYHDHNYRNFVMGIKYLLSQFSNWYMHVLCDINVSVACTCLCLFCTYRVDYTGTHCDGLGTGIWGCWKYTELNTNEAEDLSSPPRAFRISQSDKASHHLLWGWPVVVCNLWQTANLVTFFLTDTASCPNLIPPNNIFNTEDHASAHFTKHI